MEKRKAYIITIALLLIVFSVAGASFAIFTYARLGETSTTVQSGDIQFSFIEGDTVTIEDAFPVEDAIGAVDTGNMYQFTVNMDTTSDKLSMLYNVTLLTNNLGTKHFNNNEIKYNLVKNNDYMIGTSASGRLLSSIVGFDADSSTGLGVVLRNQNIAKGQTDIYKLRIWIDESVNYSGEVDENGTMTGSRNDYTYSLKVKVNASTTTENVLTGSAPDPVAAEPETSGKNVTMTLANKNGIKAYSVTNTTDTPADDQWIEVNEDGSIKQMSTGTNKQITITYTAPTYGIYYVHVKDNENRTGYGKIEIVSTGGEYDAVVTYKCPSDKYTLDENTKKCTITEYKQDQSCGTTNKEQLCGAVLVSHQQRSDGMNTFTCQKGHTGVNVTSLSPDYVLSSGRCDHSLGTTTVVNSCNVTSTIDATKEYTCPDGGTLNGTICEQ